MRSHKAPIVLRAAARRWESGVPAEGFGAFVQDQITVSDRLSVAVGLRYDWQNMFVDNNNFAPDLRSVLSQHEDRLLRGGAGVFYDRAGDNAIHEVLRSRQDRLVRFVVVNPTVSRCLCREQRCMTPRSIVVIEPGLTTPYLVQFGGGN